MLNLNYILENAGWAIIEINNGEKIIKINISYLNDSLQNLAESAIEIRNKSEKTVVFMDEPGEHWLILKKKENNELHYELRYYEDWASWNLISEDNYKIKIKGVTTITNYINEVRNNLVNIYEKHGIENYKLKWIEYEFPIEEYNKLRTT